MAGTCVELGQSSRLATDRLAGVCSADAQSVDIHGERQFRGHDTARGCVGGGLRHRQRTATYHVLQRLADVFSLTKALGQVENVPRIVHTLAERQLLFWRTRQLARLEPRGTSYVVSEPAKM